MCLILILRFECIHSSGPCNFYKIYLIMLREQHATIVLFIILLHEVTRFHGLAIDAFELVLDPRS